MADKIDGEEQWMKLDKEGKQPYLGGKLTPAELLKKLTSGGVKQWQPYFTATIKPECGGLCVLECKASKRLQDEPEPGEPSQSAKEAQMPTISTSSSRRQHEQAGHGGGEEE